MGGESFVSANSSSPVRISRDTQNKLFDNCNIVNGKLSISLNVLVIWTILQKCFNERCIVNLSIKESDHFGPKMAFLTDVSHYDVVESLLRGEWDTSRM